MTKEKKVRTTFGSVLRGMRDIGPVPGIDDQTVEPDESVRDGKRHRSLLNAAAGRVETLTVLEIDPARCRLWAHHNRLYNLLDENYCEDLIASFKAQGQVEPAIVRRLRDDPEHDYEIIAGARRHWTATYLGLKLKVEVQDITDERAFLVSDATNKGKDISEFERAIEYKTALNLYYDGSQTRMAARLNISDSKLSRYLALADLDPIVVQAFPDPREIYSKYALQLRPLWNKAPLRRALSEKACEIRGRVQDGQHLTGKEVYSELLRATQQPKREPKGETFANKSGAKFLIIKQVKAGRYTVDLNLKDVNVDEALNTLRTYLEERHK